MRVFLSALIGLIFAVDNAHAQGDMSGAGSNYCREFVSIYDSAETELKADLTLTVGQWALGYMTGLNARVDSAERKDISGFASISFGDQILAICRDEADVFIIDIITSIYFNAPSYQPSTI